MDSILSLCDLQQYRRVHVFVVTCDSIFLPCLNFIFLFFKCSQEQKKKMEPMIKLNHSVSREMESAHYLQDTKLKIAVDANQKCLGKFHLCRKTKQLQ